MNTDSDLDDDNNNDDVIDGDDDRDMNELKRRKITITILMNNAYVQR